MELPGDCVILLNNNKKMCLTGVESKLPITLVWKQFTPNNLFLILTEWCKEYNNSLHDEEVTKNEIEKYILMYDKEINDHTEKEKDMEEDEDGWVTVTGGKKRGKFAPSRKESTINKVQQKEEQRKKKKQLLNFYSFQIREEKKQSKYNYTIMNLSALTLHIMTLFFLFSDLAELRKKFELDKKRLQELKVKRTFKPF